LLAGVLPAREGAVFVPFAQARTPPLKTLNFKEFSAASSRSAVLRGTGTFCPEPAKWEIFPYYAPPLFRRGSVFLVYDNSEAYIRPSGQE